MSALIILQQMTVILILVSIGMILYGKGVVDEMTSRKISTIVVDVCNPALILSSILSGGITADRSEILTALLIGLFFYALLVALGYILPGLLRTKKENRRFYNLMTVYTNIGFIGIPVAKAILPANAILYVIVLNVLYSLLFYTHGVITLSNGKEKMNLKKVFSPGTVMAVLSLIIFALDIKLPDVLSGTVSYIGNATVFLSMVLLGVSIRRADLRNGFKNVKIWIYIAVRMVVVPCLIFFVLKLLHFDATTVLAFSLMALMPVGNLPMIQAQKTGEDTTILSLAIAVTTVISLFTITALMSLFSMLVT